jgi:uncharacterized protein YkwD
MCEDACRLKPRRLNVLHRRLGANVIALSLVVLVWVCGAGIARADACANTTIVPFDATTKTQTRVAVLCLVNGIRGERGLRRLQPDVQLTRAARFHSHDMVGNKYFGHHGVAGDDLASRLRRAGYFAEHPRGWASEVLAWGPDASAQVLVDALMNSPEHRSLIVDPAARSVGLGLSLGAPAADVASPATTLVLDFGDR